MEVKGRGADPLSLLERPRPCKAGSLWEEAPGPAPHQALEEMAGTWEHVLHLIHRLPLGRQQLFHPTPESASAKATLVYLKAQKDFPGGPVVKHPPVNVGDTGLIPGLGRLHMPLHHNYRRRQARKPMFRPREASAVRSQHTQLESSPHSLQLEKSPHSNEDQVQPYINTLKKKI